MKVIFSDRAYISIMMETAEHIKTETGGLFLGKFVDDICYVIETIDFQLQQQYYELFGHNIPREMISRSISDERIIELIKESIVEQKDILSQVFADEIDLYCKY